MEYSLMPSASKYTPEGPMASRSQAGQVEIPKVHRDGAFAVPSWMKVME